MTLNALISPKQLTLLKMLCDELNVMGIQAKMDKWGYVMATIPSNTGKSTPKIGFIAHVDTSPVVSISTARWSLSHWKAWRRLPK